MPLSDKDHQIIDKFLLGQVEENEQIYLKERQDDPEFLMALQSREKIVDFLKEKGRTEMRARFKQIREKSQVPFWQKKRWLLKFAATALLLVGILGLFRMFKSPINQIQSAFYDPYPNLVDPITKSDDKEKNAYHLYEQGRYQQALLAFEEEEDSQDRNWYRAMSYFNLAAFSDAYTLLNQFLMDPNSEYYPAAQWYQALSLAETGELSKAIEQWKIIAEEDDHPYQARSLQALKYLNAR